MDFALRHCRGTQNGYVSTVH